MKGFYIQVKNDLLDPKHFHAMGESIWLFLWLLDHMTSITEEGVGKVLGGKPIKFSDLKKELEVSERSFRRWVSILKKNGYINTLRTSYGLVMSVNKAHKSFKRRDVPKVAYQRRGDMPKPQERYAKLAQTNKTLQDETIRDKIILQEDRRGINRLTDSEYLKTLREKVAPKN